MTRNNFINSLIQTAQENIWKNQLAIAYKKDDKNTSDLNIAATEDHIKRDLAYIHFLKSNLDAPKKAKA